MSIAAKIWPAPNQFERACTIYWEGLLPEPVAQGGVEGTYTSAVAGLPHFPGILWHSRSGKIWSARRYRGAVAYIYSYTLPTR